MQTLLEQILNPIPQPTLYKLDEETGKFIHEYFWEKKYKQGLFSEEPRVEEFYSASWMNEIKGAWVHEGNITFDFNADPPESFYYDETIRQLRKSL